MASLLLLAAALTVLSVLAIDRLLAYFKEFDDTHR